MTHPGWQLIVPVKPAGSAKSRLGADADLARAIARDTVAAAAGASGVARLLVVTADPGHAALVAGLPGAALLLEAEPRGIRAAVEAGLAAFAAESTEPAPRGVLLGDLPALRPEDLAAALAAAARHERAFVRDAEGSGTTLVTARAGVELLSAFGPQSAARHAAAGLVELPLAPSSTLRQDVDTAADLRSAARAGLGPATRARLDR